MTSGKDYTGYPILVNFIFGQAVPSIGSVPVANLSEISIFNYLSIDILPWIFLGKVFLVKIWLCYFEKIEICILS